MPRRVLAIMNPISGRRNMKPVVELIAQRIQQAGGSLTLECTRQAGEGEDLARRAVGVYDAVLVVGGDGTVCEIARGLTNSEMPIAVLPTGTENLLAQKFAMPTNAPGMARLLMHGAGVPSDVGVMNGRYFLAVSGVGFDAEVVHRLARTRNGHIDYSDYFWPMWATYWGHRFPLLHIRVDGQLVFEGRALAILGVIERYSLGLRILKNARHDDGLLDLCVFPCASRRVLVRHALHVALRTHLQDSRVVYRQCREVRIESDGPVPIEIDGEVGGELPAQYGILPGAIHFLHMPQPASHEAAGSAIEVTRWS